MLKGARLKRELTMYARNSKENGNSSALL